MAAIILQNENSIENGSTHVPISFTLSGKNKTTAKFANAPNTIKTTTIVIAKGLVCSVIVIYAFHKQKYLDTIDVFYPSRKKY